MPLLNSLFTIHHSKDLILRKGLILASIGGGRAVCLAAGDATQKGFDFDVARQAAKQRIVEAVLDFIDLPLEALPVRACQRILAWLQRDVPLERVTEVGDRAIAVERAENSRRPP